MHFQPIFFAKKSFLLKSIVCASFFVSICGQTVNARKAEYVEPPEVALNREFLSNNLSFVTLACIWVFLLIIFIVFRIYYIDEKNKLRQVFDDCSPSTSQFKYLIRIRIGTSSANFQRETSAIMMDLLDVKNRFITRLSVSPSWLKSEVYLKQLDDKPRLVALKFVLNRSASMPAIGGVRISHDSYFPVGGYIFVHSVDIRSVQDNAVTMIPVLKRIFVLPPDADEFDQLFKAKSPGSSLRDSDTFIGGFSPFLSFPEYLCFFFFYANIGLFVVMMYPTHLHITNFNQAVQNGTFGFLGSFSITIFIITFYRYIIKNFYSQYRGVGPWAIVRLIFLTSLFINATTIGFAASLAQSRFSSIALSYWSLAAFISNVLLVVIIIPTVAVRCFLKVRMRKGGKLKTRSQTSMADENKPPEERTRIGVSTASRTKSHRKEAKGGKKDEVNSLKTDRQMDDNMDEAKLETIIRQKASIEEGLPDLGSREVSSVRNRILDRIQSVLRGSSKIKETEEDKFYAINKQLEQKSGTQQ